MSGESREVIWHGMYVVTVGCINDYALLQSLTSHPLFRSLHTNAEQGLTRNLHPRMNV